MSSLNLVLHSNPAGNTCPRFSTSLLTQKKPCLGCASGVFWTLLKHDNMSEACTASFPMSWSTVRFTVQFSIRGCWPTMQLDTRPVTLATQLGGSNCPLVGMAGRYDVVAEVWSDSRAWMLYADICETRKTSLNNPISIRHMALPFLVSMVAHVRNPR